MMLKKFFLFVSVLMIGGGLFAEEGMFMLNELPMNDLRQSGFQLSQQDVYTPDSPSLSDAIVQIGGGTGSFVSDQGLIITNHHVAVQALQTLSSAEHDYLKDGYEATKRGEEIYVPGYRAFIAMSFTDVTDKILTGVTDEMKPEERTKTIEKNINRVEQQYTEKNPDKYRFEVNEFYSGLKYYLFKYLKLEDIRLVYAPPQSIGAFGGDIDNWMWPRQDGDFAFFRAYVSPDGKSTGHHDDNIPYHPEKFLQFSKDGVQKGDLNFAIGYPGRTQRYRTSYSVAYNIDKSYPYDIKMYTDVINLVNAKADSNKSLQITYADHLALLNNYLKNYKGMLEGLQKANLVTQKQQEEENFKQWIQEKGARSQKYREILPRLAQTYAALDSIYPQQMIFGSMNWQVELYSAATTIDKWSVEKTKNNADRENRYTDQHIPRRKEHLKMMDKEYDPAVDAALMKYFLGELNQLPSNLQIPQIQQIRQRYPNMSPDDAIDHFVDSLYANTQLTSADQRLKDFDMDQQGLQKIHDPLLDFARSLRPVRNRLNSFTKATDGELNRERSKYIAALKEWKDGNMYPDANFTPRLTYGEVKGYSPKDAVHYNYITSINGILEKNTGKFPFNSPDKLMNLIINHNIPDQYIDHNLNTLPVDFINTLDITGGNSGSPVMDSRGRFVGIAFDGNWESISADWNFNPQITRAICVDARYILFLLDKFSTTHYVLNELTIE